MGNKSTKPNRRVSYELRQEKKQAQKTKKVLLLGCGNSGKTTIFKQLQRIYGGIIDTDSTLDEHKEHTVDQLAEISFFVIDQMQHALDILDEHSSTNDANLPPLSAKAVTAREIIQFVHNKRKLTNKIVFALKCLWNEPCIKHIYQRRSSLSTTQHLHDSAAYFWDRLDELLQPDYNPDDDCLLLYVPTLRPNENKYKIHNTIYAITEYGGAHHKLSKHKWILEHLFDDVSVIVFVASLACYDESVFIEQHTKVNIMTEQLMLFETICNHQTLRDVPLILLLNKMDLFHKKMQSVPITVCPSLAGFQGNAASYDECVEYISKSFLYANDNAMRREKITHHVMSAIDTQSIRHIFSDIQRVNTRKSTNVSNLSVSWNSKESSSHHKESSSLFGFLDNINGSSLRIVVDEDNEMERDECKQFVLPSHHKTQSAVSDDESAVTQLDSQQRQLLKMFTEFTDFEQNRSLSYLIANEWDLQSAIDQFIRDRPQNRESRYITDYNMPPMPRNRGTVQLGVNNNDENDEEEKQHSLNRYLSMGYRMVMDTPNGDTECASAYMSYADITGARDAVSVTTDDSKLDDNPNAGSTETDEEKVCQMEFERFLSWSVPKGIEKYLRKFQQNGLFDVRYIRYIDEEMLRKDIGMNTVDTRIFMKHMNDYKQDCDKFERLLTELNMKEKYYTLFVKHGIATLWSFHHHINSTDDLRKIIKNNNDCAVILKSVNGGNSPRNDSREDSNTVGSSDGQVEGNHSKPI